VNLSPHFTYAELTASAKAAEIGIDNTPDAEEVENLKRLCAEILEPLRHLLGPIQVTSGYRCIALNRAVGSKDTSHHIDGRAADIKIKGLSPKTVCEAIAALELPYQQCIVEATWTHVSIPVAGHEPARQNLTIGPDGTRPGFH
jgi:hypothetical protein